MEEQKHKGDNGRYDKLIDERLRQLRLSPLNLQKDNLARYLRLVEGINQESNNSRNELIKKYKSLNLSFLSISKAINISRQTIYNNDILEMYIDKVIDEQQKEDVFYKMEYLQEQVQEKQEEINKMQLRDVEIEKQAYEIDKLTAQISESDRTIHDLEERNHELIMEVEKYKMELNKQHDNIIKFKSK